MNFSRLKYKPLFYSLFIHILIVLLVFILVYKVNKMDRNHALVDLRSVEISSPKIECFCEAEVKEAKLEKVSPVRTATVAPPKKIKKVPKPKTVSKKQVEIAWIEPLPVPQEVEPVEEQTEEEAIEEQVIPLTTPQEKSTSSVVTTNQSVSYEARYMEDNLALINALIKKHLSYPRMAKKRGLQGKVLVSFRLQTNGEVVRINTTGNASPIFKKSAIETIRKAAGSFPVTQENLDLQIPIVYKLR